MTPEEINQELGSMVQERRQHQQHLACIENKLQRFGRALDRARASIYGDNNWNWNGAELTLDPVTDGLPDINTDAMKYPSMQELGEALFLRSSLQKRITELDRLIDA